LSGWTGNNKWQLDLKTEKVFSLSPGRGTLTTVFFYKHNVYKYTEPDF